jgi:MYXO-CTERM domain-containing protein
MQYWWSENGANSAACDFWGTGACVAIPEGDLVEVSFLSDGAGAYAGNRPFLHGGPFELGLAYEELSAGDTCVQLRRRALNGVLGEPTAVCAADLPTVQLLLDTRPVCTEAGVTPDEGGSMVLADLVDWSALPREQPDYTQGPYEHLGCTFGAARSPTLAAPFSLLALAAVLARRRRKTTTR